MRVEARWLHENLVFYSDLADVVKHSREFNLFNLFFRKLHLPRDSSGNARDAISMTTSESILRVDCLRQGANRAEEESSRFGVLRE